MGGMSYRRRNLLIALAIVAAMSPVYVYLQIVAIQLNRESAEMERAAARGKIAEKDHGKP